MSIDPSKIQTQEETGEQAPIDQVEARVESEMKRIEGSAKERVAQGLQDEQMEEKARHQKEEGERELNEEKKHSNI
ncbi:MAG: hypothetical protein NVSMB56_14100 [Pyrinomonadaceae bacterium]